MKTRTALLALALAIAAPAFAAESQVEQLSQETGLSERSIRMLVGNRTPYAEYRYAYNRSLDKFTQALGKERAARFLAGETITLNNGTKVNLAMLGRDRPIKHMP